MLYLKNRKGSQKGFCSLIGLLALAVLLLTGCGKDNTFKNKEITMEAFSDMKAPAFVFDFQQVTRLIAETVALAEQHLGQVSQYGIALNAVLFGIVILAGYMFKSKGVLYSAISSLSSRRKL